MKPHRMSDVTIDISCGVVAKCAGARATVTTYGTKAPSTSTPLPITAAGESSIRVTVPSLPSYAYIALE